MTVHPIRAAASECGSKDAGIPRARRRQPGWRFVCRAHGFCQGQADGGGEAELWRAARRFFSKVRSGANFQGDSIMTSSIYGLDDRADVEARA